MKRDKKTRSRIPVMGDMLCSILTLPMALSHVEGTYAAKGSVEQFAMFVIAFFLLGAARVFRAFRFRGASRVHYVKYLVYGLSLMACGLAAAALDERTATRALLAAYWGSLIADRAIACATRRTGRSLLLNLMAAFLLLWLFIKMFNSELTSMLMCVVAVIHSMLSILAVSFARINLRSLGKVVRETYAAEIIGGLLLLVFAFSYILRAIEPGLDTLGDALWYCFAIVTTIGFGDVTASTVVGRVLSVILGMYGIIVVALITSVIVNYYGEMKGTKGEDGEGSRE